MGPGDRGPFTASEEGPYSHQRVPVVQQQQGQVRLAPWGCPTGSLFLQSAGPASLYVEQREGAGSLTASG